MTLESCKMFCWQSGMVKKQKANSSSRANSVRSVPTKSAISVTPFRAGSESPAKTEAIATRLAVNGPILLKTV